MLLLLLLVLVHHVISKELSKQTNYVIRKINSCPPEGYFFLQETKNAVSGPCILCFCTSDEYAICWPRDNKRCDKEHYQHNKRGTRKKRSPGLTSLFFKDALKDVLNNNKEELCKPFEGSYSIGCPPDDWCKGCTVCDCNAKSQWECHTLSFCPEQENKEQKQNNAAKKKKPRKQQHSKTKVLPRKHITDNNIADSNSENDKSKTKARNKLITSYTVVNNDKNKMKVANFKTGRMKYKQNSERIMKKKAAQKILPITNSQHMPITHSLKNKRQVKTIANRKGRALLMNSSHRSQEIKRSISTRKGQVFNNNLTKKSSQMKNNMTRKSKMIDTKKSTPAKIQPVKKKSPVKAALPVKKSPQLRKTSPGKFTTIHPLEKEEIRQITVSNSDALRKTRKPLRRKVRLTTIKTTTTPKMKFPVKFENPNMTILSHEVAKNFVAAFHKILNNNLAQRIGKQLSKRSIAEPDNEINDSLENTANDWRFSRKDTAIEDSIYLSNELNNVNRIRRFVLNSNITDKYSIVSEAGSSTENLPLISDNSINPETTVNNMQNYYSYNVNNIQEKKGPSDRFELQSNKDTNTLGDNFTSDAVDNFLIIVEPYNAGPLIDIHNTSRNVSKAPIEKRFSYNEKGLKSVESNLIDKIDYLKRPSQILRMSMNPNYDGHRKKIYTSDISRKIVVGKKKFKLQKVVNLIDRTKLDPQFTTLNNSTKVINPKLFQVQNVITKFLNGFLKKNDAKTSGPNRFKVMKYLQNLFNNIFNQIDPLKDLDSNTSGTFVLKKDRIISTICKHFGACNVNSNNKEILDYKIQNLSVITNDMIRTIRKTKSLLQLIDFAEEKREMNNNDSNSLGLQGDFRKLSYIMKGTYLSKQNTTNFTETDSKKIYCIKNYTHKFIRRTVDFARILTDIIELLTASETTSKEKLFNETENKGFQHIMLHPDANNKLEQTHIKMLTLKKIMGLLTDYKLLQNKLINKMYRVLSRNNISPTNDDIRKNAKNLNKPKSFTALKMYTGDIISNLKKLKSLTEPTTSLISRNKRDLSNTNTDYLLLLMEHLMKQYYALDAAPINDGLDLIIDAIRHAPDIKTIRKKVLNDSVFSKHVMPYVMKTKMLLENITEQNSLRFDKISKEINDTSRSETKMENSIDESQAVSNSDSDEKVILSNSEQSDPVTDSNTFRKGKVNEAPEKVEKITTKLFENKKTRQNYSKKNTKNNVNSNDNKRRNIYLTNVDYNAEEIITPNSRRKIEMTTERKSLIMKMTQAPALVGNTKVKPGDHDLNRKYLDWVDETMEEEIKENNRNKSNYRKNAISDAAETVRVKSMSKSSNNIKEKMRQKVIGESTVLDKEMNLFNSLDVEPEKPEVEISDSKESSEDVLSSYFV